MIDTNTILNVIDTILITPYRIPVPEVIAFWFGTAVVALWCTVTGEISMSLIYLWNRKYYTDLNQKMTRMHNISIEAIRHKNKKVYKSANHWANEYFGKVFFSHAALFAVSLWPVAFALAWLQGRFGSISIHTIPYINFGLGYPFVFILTYIVLRFCFSKIRKFIPFLGKIDKLKEEDALEAGEMTSWTDLAPEFKKNNSSKQEYTSPAYPLKSNS